ncbi:Predicted L-lactate dehydrogenase, Iron-sulfur cluster-binding subunit YkgF [hydrothermal vent metagenome]|uniref:Predicted L-lactate dehydrogenase, Iron-sulfur cluster-binding subunit YkgF n=1 Tax=hydrothermal vent metagenome TaxID=652676 RepID=A0A3B0VH27_9ZZZZ
MQLNAEPPSHIVAPIIHKSKESIQKIFTEHIQMPVTDDTHKMTQFARQKLRQDFLTSDMGISGGNFIVAETGTLCLVTNEGNARMVTSLPPVHVAVVGIKKIVASLADYATLTQLLPRSATGQKMTVYTHMINGPRRPHEAAVSAQPPYSPPSTSPLSARSKFCQILKAGYSNKRKTAVKPFRQPATLSP